MEDRLHGWLARTIDRLAHRYRRHIEVRSHADCCKRVTIECVERLACGAKIALERLGQRRFSQQAEYQVLE